MLVEELNMKYKVEDQSQIKLCRHCGKQTIHKLLVEYYCEPVEEIDEHVGIVDSYTIGYRFWQCLECLKPTLEETCHFSDYMRYYEFDDYENIDFDNFDSGDVTIVYPARTLTAYLPIEIREEYCEALRLQKINRNSCAVEIGKTLEAICDHKNAKGKNFEARIGVLDSSSELPERLVKVAHFIRQIRNLGAHENKVTDEEIKTALKGLEFILEYLYFLPAKKAEFEKFFISLPNKESLKIE